MLPLIGLVLIPGILWGWSFYHAQRYKKIYLPLLFKLFIGGMACGFIALVLNHSIEKYTVFWSDSEFPQLIFLGQKISLYASGFWFMVGVNEEFAKLLVILAVVYPSKHLKETFDGILYMAIIALGFATIENVFYLNQYGLAVVITRTLITLPAHAFMSVPMGYFVAKSRIHLDNDPTSTSRYHQPMILILKGWMISVLLHAGYDFLLSQQLNRAAYTLIFLMGTLTLWLVRLSLHENRLKYRNS